MSKLTPDEVAEINRRMVANATKKQRPDADNTPTESMTPEPKRRGRGRPPKKETER